MIDVQVAAHDHVDVLRGHARGAKRRRQFSAPRPADVDVTEPGVDEHRRFPVSEEEASDRDVHAPVIGDHVLMGREVEPDVERLRHLAEPVAEGQELDIAD